jgi:biotin transporter BioY
MMTYSTVADIWRPGERTHALLYNIWLIFGGSVFIALSAQLAIGLPVPFTMQEFAVLMIGALFGSRLACMTVGLYLFEGFAGLPVFAHHLGGLPVLLGPTGGFLVGFLAAAYVTGFLAERGWDRKFTTTALAMLAGNVLIYTFGVIRLNFLFGFHEALVTGLYPFAVGAVIKILVAAALLPSVWRLLQRCGLLNKS